MFSFIQATGRTLLTYLQGNAYALIPNDEAATLTEPNSPPPSVISPLPEPSPPSQLRIVSQPPLSPLQLVENALKEAIGNGELKKAKKLYKERDHININLDFPCFLNVTDAYKKAAANNHGSMVAWDDYELRYDKKEVFISAYENGHLPLARKVANRMEYNDIIKLAEQSVREGQLDKVRIFEPLLSAFTYAGHRKQQLLRMAAETGAVAESPDNYRAILHYMIGQSVNVPDDLADHALVHPIVAAYNTQKTELAAIVATGNISAFSKFLKTNGKLPLWRDTVILTAVAHKQDSLLDHAISISLITPADVFLGRCVHAARKQQYGQLSGLLARKEDVAADKERLTTKLTRLALIKGDAKLLKTLDSHHLAVYIGQEDVLHAATEGHAEIIARVGNEYHSTYIIWNCYEEALQQAVKGRQPKSLSALLNVRNNNSWSPELTVCREAIATGDRALVMPFLEKGLRYIGEDGMFLTHVLSPANGKATAVPPAVQALFDAGSALMLAVMQKETDLSKQIKTVTDLSCGHAYYFSRAMIVAAGNSDTVTIDKMIKAGANLAACGDLALSKALEAKHMPTVQYFLGKNIPLTDTHFHKLSAWNNPEATDILLAHAYAKSPYMGGIYNEMTRSGAVNIARAIAQKYPETLPDPDSELKSTVWWGDRRIDVGSMEIYDHRLQTNGHIRAMLALERGADIHADNDAAIRGATESGNIVLVRTLLLFHPDIDKAPPGKSSAASLARKGPWKPAFREEMKQVFEDYRLWQGLKEEHPAKEAAKKAVAEGRVSLTSEERSLLFTNRLSQARG